jgi:hypothetical protein
MLDGSTREHDDDGSVAASKDAVRDLLHLVERRGGYPAAASQPLAGRLSRRLLVLGHVDRVCRDAYEKDDRETMTTVHRLLSRLYDERFSVPQTGDTAPDAEAAEIMHLIEGYMFAAEDARLKTADVEAAPRTGAAFMRWLLDIIKAHPSARHPFYESYLPQRAVRADITYFLAQETTLDPRFDDVLALLQIGTPDHIKLAFARNYWDEVGNGSVAGFHTNLFQLSLDSAGATPDYIRRHLALESIVCGNLSMALSLHRNYFAKAIGYFGVTEFLVPRRFPKLIAAWERLGLEDAGIAYHRLHSELDAGHGEEWFEMVIAPHIDRYPGQAAQIARGALYRLNSAQRYLDDLQQHCEQAGGIAERAEDVRRTATA